MIDVYNELERVKKEAKYIVSRSDFIKNTITNISGDGDILEFGVFTGRSLKLISELCPERKIYGFDSFEGLPEAWPGSFEKTHPKGHFNVNGKIPKINNPNISFIKGFFDDTLPDFVSKYNSKIALLHIDCDIYSSTQTILHCLKNHINRDMIIMFDELIGYDGFEINEMKAWLELAHEKNIKYQYLFWSKYQASLKIL